MNFHSKLLLAAAALSASTSAYAFPIATTGEGFKVIASGGEIIAKYEGNSAAYSNDLYLGSTLIFNNQSTPVGTTVSLGTFGAGEELLFRLYVNNTGYSYYTGPGSLNPDGMAHARVESNWQPGTTLVSFEDLYDGPFVFNDLSFSFTNTVGTPGGVPEPATWAMMLIGFGAMGAAIRRGKVAKVSYA